ncbi:nucleotidyltransferase family protein [Paenibacillus albiflavus]|uniref:Nucleotidyltransferase family protein n=1 Tax=Paenibacillus albiflavus TaxID=2545760 RepID=A0A4R4EIN6_9BACL|nr:nucleotidyltransferase family protein [Paenibacillus albiflavus]TCZ79253.1 nucleotidyltransferase family protein [Paenibacillus albiflavus]
MNNESELIRIMQQSELLMKVFDRVKLLGLKSYYIGAGCIAQTAWNHLTSRPLHYGISDIDIVYYEDQDLSSEAEEIIINRGKRQFADIPIALDIKNQARVHLWYEKKFGIPLQPYRSLEEAIQSWPTTATSLGVRQELNGEWVIYAPYGLTDLLTMKLRANKKLITEEIYRKKVNKWLVNWPELQVIEWNESTR